MENILFFENMIWFTMKNLMMKKSVHDEKSAINILQHLILLESKSHKQISHDFNKNINAF